MLKLLGFLWQLPQNVLGFILSIGTEKWLCPKGTIDNKEDVYVWYSDHIFNCGVSLGRYIILDTKYLNYEHDITIKHEHGHQKQSRILGWLYLLTIGLLSVSGNIYDRIFHKGYKWYYNQPWEAWADKLGGVKREWK